MLGRNGQVKLIDFGIARFFLPQSNATMIGTQGYAPPEQYRGTAEARSDLYALGATMHHALSGRDPAAEPPFSFPKLRTLCPDLNPALADLVDQALEYDVVHRMADAAEFKERLLAIKAGAATASINGATTAPRSRANRKCGCLWEMVAASDNPAPEDATVILRRRDTRDRYAMPVVPRKSFPCGFALLFVLRRRRDASMIGNGGAQRGFRDDRVFPNEPARPRDRMSRAASSRIRTGSPRGATHVRCASSSRWWSGSVFVAIAVTGVVNYLQQVRASAEASRRGRSARSRDTAGRIDSARA